MKTKELRIGNLVRRKGTDIITTVEEVLSSRINCFNPTLSKLSTAQLSNFEPIPLTDELILRFKFHKYKDQSVHPNRYWLTQGDWGFVIDKYFMEQPSWMFGHEYYDSGDDSLDYTPLWFKYNLRYVHELQNLFFALTGTELVLSDNIN